MKLDIVLVTETYPPEVNGVAMTVGRLVDGMRARGHRVDLVRPRQSQRDKGDAGDVILSGVPLPGYPGLRFGLPAGGRLARHWRQRRPDLVHVVTEGPLGWSAVNTARRLGIPVTSGFHTNFDRYSVHYGIGWMRPAVAAYLRALHRRTAATLVPTEAMAADLAGDGVAGVRVVGRGVDTALFDPQRRSAALRAQWQADDETLVCLNVGRLAPEKNLPLVVRSFAAIESVAPGARMVWVGDGPARRELEQANPNHIFAGARIGEDLAAHYASADLFLFPSLSETYGNVVAEAMGSGLPVLAFRSAAAAELIDSGRNGVLIAPGDDGQFVAAAQRLAGERSLLAGMGEEARRVILPRSWEGVVDTFETVIREALAEGRGIPQVAA
ncbi:MAG: glycosyltransferase family 1 protein [Rhodocyclaceae bacterium]|nr:glycosyltransferase family 1 protein [Rhodocyclaceae bacterium]